MQLQPRYAPRFVVVRVRRMTLNPNNVSFRDTVHMTGKPGPRGVRLY